jgi:hypothetical protein
LRFEVAENRCVGKLAFAHRTGRKRVEALLRARIWVSLNLEANSARC